MISEIFVYATGVLIILSMLGIVATLKNIEEHIKVINILFIQHVLGAGEDVEIIEGKE